VHAWDNLIPCNLILTATAIWGLGEEGPHRGCCEDRSTECGKFSERDSKPL